MPKEIQIGSVIETNNSTLEVTAVNGDWLETEVYGDPIIC